jgi:hypothetical protein
MSALAQLPADQQAVLDLVLKRGRSYAGIAGALRLDVDAVRARARAAVCALGSSARSVPPERQAQITDWLLGQADPRTADDAVAYLSSSRAARSWARSAVEGLGPLAEGRLPLLPVPAPARRAERAERRPWPPAAGLAAVAIPSLLVFAVAIVVGSRDEPRVPARSEPAPPSVWLTAAQQRGSARDADGAAEVLSRGARQSLVVTAGGLPRSTGTAAYTVWLTRGTGSAATYVATLRTDAEGRIDGLAPLRVDPARYSEVLVARQRSAGTPTRPGLVVLRGPLR